MTVERGLQDDAEMTDDWIEVYRADMKETLKVIQLV